MRPSRLSFDDAITLWRARDVYRVQAVLRGLVVLFFLMEFFGYLALGYWYLGLVAIGLQWGLLWCLRWALRWVRWAVWWGIDHAKVAMVTWMHQRRR